MVLAEEQTLSTEILPRWSDFFS